MFRLYYKVFHGECRAPAELREHIHEPAGTVVNPLWALAFLSVVGGLVGFPLAYGELIGVEDSHSLNNWLSKVVGEASYHVAHSTEYLMAPPAAFAGSGPVHRRQFSTSILPWDTRSGSNWMESPEVYEISQLRIVTEPQRPVMPCASCWSANVPFNK